MTSLEEKKRRERGRFRSVDPRFVEFFGLRSLAVLVETAVWGGVDLRGWDLDVAGEEFINARVDPTKSRLSVGRGVNWLTRPMRTFVLLHELGHVRQFNSGDLDRVYLGRIVRWKGEIVVPIVTGPRSYAALPWERDASDFAMSSPVFEPVSRRDIDSLDGNLRETFLEHLKMNGDSKR